MRENPNKILDFFKFFLTTGAAKAPDFAAALQGKKIAQLNLHQELKNDKEVILFLHLSDFSFLNSSLDTDLENVCGTPNQQASSG